MTPRRDRPEIRDAGRRRRGVGSPSDLTDVAFQANVLAERKPARFARHVAVSGGREGLCDIGS